MKGKLHIIIFLSLWTMTMFLNFNVDANANAGDRWQSGFDTTGIKSEVVDSILTIDQVLSLMAIHNPSLRSLSFIREAAQGRLKQASLWQNPEISAEFEEVDWDAPGFSESEFSVSLSQEFELFGQRQARKQVALTNIESTNFEIELAAFDLYLEAKSRFNKLLHSQKRAELAKSSVSIAEHIVSRIEYRMKRGVALESELLLAQLEMQRAGLISEEAQQVSFSAQVKLAALWNSNSSDITASAPEEPDYREALNILPTLSQQIDSTRYVRQWHHAKEMTLAAKRLAATESKPGITLSGGFKRLEVNNSKSFMFGISLPLPLFNRNQGQTAALKARIRSEEYEQERARLETKAFLSSAISQLNQLISSHQTLDSLLLPTAEHAYKTIEKNYNVGRIPFTSLLEAERSLIELRFQHNDVLNNIYEQLIAIERVSGIRIY